MIILNPNNAVEAAVGASSAQIALTMNSNLPPATTLYAFVANVACWIAQGANPTASAASGSMYVPANVFVYLDGFNGAKLAVIQDSTGGKATLAPLFRG